MKGFTPYCILTWCLVLFTNTSNSMEHKGDCIFTVDDQGYAQITRKQNGPELVRRSKAEQAQITIAMLKSIGTNELANELAKEIENYIKTLNQSEQSQ